MLIYSKLAHKQDDRPKYKYDLWDVQERGWVYLNFSSILS